MTRQEAEQAVKEDLGKHNREWFESLPEPRIKFMEEDEDSFFFDVDGCEIGVFKDTGIVVVLPTEGGAQ